MTASNVHLVSHPLVQHKLTLMRERDRSTKGFRELLNEIGMLLYLPSQHEEGGSYTLACQRVQNRGRRGPRPVVKRKGRPRAPWGSPAEGFSEDR